MTPEKLRKWRTKHKLTRLALAELLTVHKMTIYKWEKEIQPIPGFLHLALAELHRRLKPKRPAKRT